MFVTFEGVDGCGKTTQIELLKKLYETAVVTREPGGTAVGDSIRDIVLNNKYKDVSHMTEVMLYATSRAQLVYEVISPNLERGNMVISDRYIDSSIVYQGMGRGVGVDVVRNINLNATGGLLPDVTFLIDVDIETCMRRVNKNGEPDRIEKAGHEFFEMVRLGFLELAKNDDRFVVIDGSQSIEEIHKIVLEKIKLLEK